MSTLTAADEQKTTEVFADRNHLAPCELPDGIGSKPDLVLHGRQAPAGNVPSANPGVARAKTLFFLGLLLAGSGLISPPVALAGGLAYGFSLEHPLAREAGSLSKLLLQLSVVLLGFGIDLHQVVHAGASGLVYTAASIGIAVLLGTLLGRLLRVGSRAAYLITMGTAICGGSAIAALAPITEASEEEISIAMGTVFVLNAVALLLFPAVGWALHLSQNQFGLWSALAIHDTSSVVGASARYGSTALAVSTTVKLARALWIIPVSLGTAALCSRRQQPCSGPAGTEAPRAGGTAGRRRISIPWFILWFLLASVASTYAVRFAPAFASLNHLGKTGLTATLFLIGSTLSRRTLRRVGFAPMLQGVLLWVVVGSASLAAIYFGLISL